MDVSNAHFEVTHEENATPIIVHVVVECANMDNIDVVTVMTTCDEGEVLTHEGESKAIKGENEIDIDSSIDAPNTSMLFNPKPLRSWSSLSKTPRLQLTFTQPSLPMKGNTLKLSLGTFTQ